MQDDIAGIALRWHEAGLAVALATVVETWGSAPRPAGAQLCVDAAGDMAGSVSGGCVEGAVLVEAQEAIAEGGSRVLDFGVSDDDAFAVGLACGGRIRILVEPVRPDDLTAGMLRDLAEARRTRHPCAYVVDLQSFARRIEAGSAHAERVRRDRSGVEPDGRTFVAVRNPPLRLAVVGGVHIAQALIPMARMAGYDIRLIDPREGFASAARFPDVPIDHDWPDEALGRFAPDARSAVVTLTHDPKLDDPALRAALASEAFYIGALGSTRTHAKRVARLGAEGHREDAIGRIHAPVGLPIGAASPAEIAIAILAQITDRLRRP